MAALPPWAMQPIRVSSAQGFTKSLYCPTPDQPTSLSDVPAVKLPAAELRPLTFTLEVRPASLAYFSKVLPPTWVARVAKAPLQELANAVAKS